MKPTPAKTGFDSEQVARIREMLHGYRTTCVLVAAHQLGLFEHLGSGAVQGDELARLAGADPRSLRRLLRALVSLGLVEWRENRVALTAPGRLLAADAQALRAELLLTAEEYLPAWSGLAESIRSGETAFDRVFGLSVWQHRAGHPELNAAFNRFISDVQGRDIATLVDCCDLGRFGQIIDVGGGRGHLLAAVLSRWPQVRGILFDQPHVVTAASEVLGAAGVLDRCRLAAGSFFETLPDGADLCVLQNILHDWDDARVVAILRNCRRALQAGASLVVIENVLGEDATHDSRLAMLDLHMMTVLGGRERTRKEYHELMTAAGFSPREAVPVHGSTAALFAVAV